MARIVFIPYGPSKGLFQLRQALREKGHRTYKSTMRGYVRRRDDMFIMWGNGDVPRGTYAPGQPLNVDLGYALNKLNTFQMWRRWNEDRQMVPERAVSYPKFATSRAQAIRELRLPIVARTILNGHEGAGIVIAETHDQLPDAALYTEYKKKLKEFRVHLFNREVIDVTQKRKRNGANVDTRIRNTAGGWVFTRTNIQEPADLRQQALVAINALGLDFGAVDIIYNQYENKCYCLEINTAPGIEGTTVDAYANAIIRWKENFR